jgi:hypothetical protein
MVRPGLYPVTSAYKTTTVPLSAYNIVPEFTYRPNDTLPAIALSRLVPSVFQPLDANSFTPQLLTVGDIIRLNGSLLDYTIVAAFDGLDETKPVSSFSYYNNPFSDGCDVVCPCVFRNRAVLIIPGDECHCPRWPSTDGQLFLVPRLSDARENSCHHGC